MRLRLGMYQHYKGNFYRVHGIGVSGLPLKDAKVISVAHHSEDIGKLVQVFSGRKFFILEGIIGKLERGEYIVYEALYESELGSHAWFVESLEWEGKVGRFLNG